MSPIAPSGAPAVKLENPTAGAPSPQNQAKAALSFLYRQVLEIDLPRLDEVVAATKGTQRLPVLLAR